MKRMICLLVACTALFTLSGCRSLFERDYYYEAPYSGDIGTRSDTATEIRNYNMLKTALTNMITNHTERGEFRFSNYNGNLSEDLAAACFEIKSEHPLGAYAVETLSYDTSYVVSYYVANIFISYKRTAEELNSIVYTTAVPDFDESVREAVDGFAPELVIRCFASGVDEEYIAKLVQRHYYDNPVALAAEPGTEVTRYPTDGANGIYDIRFIYGADAQRSASMARATQDALEGAAEAMTETDQPLLALEAARWLSDGCMRSDGIYADTAYGALALGRADSKGMALAYRALCGSLGIDCTVVKGQFGSMTTEPHFWNIIGLDGEHYHVDVSAMAEDPAAAFLLNDDALWGRYIWEVSEYPACDGPLSYAEVAGIPEEEPTEEEPGNPEAPEPTGTEPPQESPEPTGTEPPQESPEPAETEPPQESPEPTGTEPPQESPEPTETEPPQESPEPTETEPPQTSPEPTEDPSAGNPGGTDVGAGKEKTP